MAKALACELWLFNLEWRLFPQDARRVAEPIDFSFLDGLLPPVPAHHRVGLLGGSFNPPHLGHSLLALYALSVVPIDELWVMPCADHPFGKDLVDFKTRIQLCQHTFAHLGQAVKVIEIEAKMPQPNYTAQTLRAIHCVRDPIELYWIAGSDLHEDLHRWREPEAIPTLARLITINREGHTQKENFGFPLPEISSSMIREKRRAGESIAGFVERKTIQCMDDRGLYR